MGSRTWAAVAAAVVATAGLAAGAPAGATPGLVTATCITTLGAAPTTGSFTYAAHAPESVAPGQTFSVTTDIGYHVPPNATLGAAIYAADGADAVQPNVSSPPGSPSVHGDVAFRATGPAGSTIAIRLDFFGAIVAISGSSIAETCKPDHRLVVVSVPIGVPSVSIGDAAVVEGDGGTRSLRFGVALSRPADHDVHISYVTEDGTATAPSDYSPRSGTLLIPVGRVGQVVSVPVRGDRVAEGKESFRVRLMSPDGAALGRSTATGRVIDDDPQSGLRVAIGDASVVEGLIGTRTLRFTVSLSAASAQPVAVSYTTADGSAIASDDYGARSGTVTILAGVTSTWISVAVRPDGTTEGAEWFTASLNGATGGAVIARANGVGTIIDDD